jgi:3-hydroxymyristoyl/3-hydroxydecanoyl-(acyl carrier protein) dehydratase
MTTHVAHAERASSDRMPDPRAELLGMPATLLQAPPFRFVDLVTSLDLDAARISGAVSMEVRDDFYFSNFLFGPLVIEALAQMSSLLLARLLDTRSGRNTRGGGILASIERARFAPPPENARLELVVTLTASNPPYFQLEGVARQDGSFACEALFSVRSSLGER